MRTILVFMAMGLGLFAMPAMASEATAKNAPPLAVAADLAAQWNKKYTGFTPPKTLPALGWLRANQEAGGAADFAGKPLLINFWASWCAPCVRELPALARLAELGQGEIEVLAISVDRKGPPFVDEYITRQGLKVPPLAFDPRSEWPRALNAKGLPLTLLINEKGEWVGKVEGELAWDAPALAAFLRPALGLKP